MYLEVYLALPFLPKRHGKAFLTSNQSKICFWMSLSDTYIFSIEALSNSSWSSSIAKNSFNSP